MEFVPPPSERTPLISGSAEVQTTVYLYVAASLSVIGGFLFGYDTGVISGALLQVSRLQLEPTRGQIFEGSYLQQVVTASRVFQANALYIEDSTYLQLRDNFDLDTVWQEWVVAITIAGAWMFAILAGKLNDLVGRKWTVIIASSVFTLGSGLMAGAPNRWWLLIGRLIVGFGVGGSILGFPALLKRDGEPNYFRGLWV